MQSNYILIKFLIVVKILKMSEKKEKNRIGSNVGASTSKKYET